MDFAMEDAGLDGLDLVIVLRAVMCARRRLRASVKQTQVLVLSWHGVVSFAFRHLLSTRRCSVSQVMRCICGAKDSFIRKNFVEWMPHLKESLENKRKRKLVKEVEVAPRCQRLGDLRKIERARRRQILINDKNLRSRISARLAWIVSKLRHDAVNDRVEDILR